MSMSKTVLGALIKSKIDALLDADKNPPEDPEAYRVLMFEALAEAVIEHITGNMEITTFVTGTIASPSGPGTITVAQGDVDSEHGSVS